MKQKKKEIFSLVGAVALIILGYFLFQYLKYVSTDNAQVEAHSFMLAAKVSGYITKVNVEEGQTVKKGDVLLEIDSRDYENNLKQISAELASLEARRKDVAKNFHRISELFKSGSVTAQQYDSSAAMNADLNAKVESVSAQIAEAKLNVENTKILAPMDGFIVKKAAEVGQLASPGLPLIGFVDSTERWVTANFKETEIEGIKLGALSYADIDAISTKTYVGRVISIGAATGATFTLLPPDNASGNFTKVVQRVAVRIKLENLTPEDIFLLKAGLSAIIKVEKH